MLASTSLNRKKRLPVFLAIGAVAMFGFGYALSPLYNVLCKKLGINGKTDTATSPAAVISGADLSRTVTVQFLAIKNANLPWKFYPYRKSVDIHPVKIPE